MSSIDERIVKMSFDNSDFESRVSKTLSSLEKLNEVLNKTGNTADLSQLNKSLKEVKTQLNALDIDTSNMENLNGIEKTTSKWEKFKNVMANIGNSIKNSPIFQAVSNDVENATDTAMEFADTAVTIKDKFSAMGAILEGVFINIGSRIVDTGIKMGKALTIDPVMSGFSEYETKVNAISTILANTKDEGKTIDDVSGALNELNEYADMTIYNFAQMTENIGRFTAAGVGLEDSVASIKGLANLAAFFGVEPAKASSAMYQMSQAIAAGKVQLMDWNSLVNAGMGGEALQEALIRTSEIMGTGADAAIKKYGSFRESLTKGAWLTSDVMVETLKQISGAYKESELREQGYSATQAKAIADMAKQANQSATEVRTITGMIDAMKESVQSGWAISWEHIIGNKEQATETLTAVKDAFDALIKPSTDARNKMLEFWNQNGGRADVLEGLSNIFNSLGKGAGAIKDAFRDIFPPMTGKKLVELSEGFKELTERFKMSDETANKIKSTFKGLFSIFGLIKDAVLSLADGLSPLGDIIENMFSYRLNVFSKIGDVISSVADGISSSGIFDKIGDSLESSLEGIRDFITGFETFIGSFFDYVSSLDFGKVFGAIGNAIKPLLDGFGSVLGGLGKLLGGINLNTVLGSIFSGGVITSFTALTDSISGIGDSFAGFFKNLGGVTKNIKGLLDSVRESLEAWQNNLNAGTLLKVAGAVAILAASLVVLSEVEGAKIASSLIAIVGLMTTLLGATYFLANADFGEALNGFLGFSKMGKVTSAILKLAAALALMAVAMRLLADLDWNDLGVSMVAFIGMTGLLVASAKSLSKIEGDLTKTAGSLILFAAALNIMALALKLMGTMNGEEMISGLLTMGIVLAEIGIFTKKLETGGMNMSFAASMVAIAGSMIVFAQAIKMIGGMNTNDILEGLAGIAAILLEVAAFAKLTKGADITHTSVAMIAMGAAMNVLSWAVRSFANMSWMEIAQGLTAMAGGLLAVGLAAETIEAGKGLGAAVAVTAMSAAMLLLSTALKSFGEMSWEQIVVGFIALGGALVILNMAMSAMVEGLPGAAAMLVMSAALALFIPQLIALSALDPLAAAVGLITLAGSLAILGAAGALITPAIPGLLGLAAAIALFGVGAAAAGAGMALFAAGLATLAGIGAAGGFALIELIRQLINLLPQLGTKMGEAMVNMATALGVAGPQLATAFTQLITAMLQGLTTSIPAIVQAGTEIVTALLQILVQSVPQMVDAGLKLVTGILQGIASNIGNVVQAGCDVIVNFINGVAANLGQIIDAGINLALSFIEGIADGITNNQARLEAAIRDIITAMANAGLAVINGAISGFVQGGTDLITGLIDGISSMVSGVDAGVRKCIDAGKRAATNLGNTLYQAGVDLINGFKNGITSMASSIAEAAKGVAKKAVDGVKSFLGINSPSRVFMEIGKYTSEGFAVGIEKNSNVVTAPARELANKATDAVNKSLRKINDMFSADIDANPTIRPVLDLSNVEKGSKTINELMNQNEALSLNTQTTGMISSTVGTIQNRNNNAEVVSALKDLKNNLSGNTNNYTINGITYDDGSNIVSAVETLVRAARIERRI